MPTTILRSFLLNCLCPSNSYWPSTSPGPRVVACNGQKYNREGHQNTTALIAEMAGLDASRARRLAYFSQAPEVVFSAFIFGSICWGVGVCSLLLVLPVEHYERTTLLAWWSHEAVIERRRNLKAQIISLRSRSNDEDGWKIGFLIHAMGDSYAHAYGALGDLHGYGEFLGHAFDNGEQDNRPDMIVMNNNYRIYIQYVQALLELSDGSANADLKDLNESIAGVKAEVEVKHVSNSDFVQFVQTYTYCGNANRVHDQQAGNLATEELKKLEQDIERVKVSDFLSDMRDRL